MRGAAHAALPVMEGQEDGVRNRTISGWMLAAAMAVAALPALAQQDEGPILLPKPKPQPSRRAPRCW